MKDSEFIELLNLYLDHEISAVDAVRLETEVQANAARRRIYEDYCRMQKACKVLAVDFQAEPLAGKVIPFEPSADATGQPARAARGLNGLYTWGTVAAAACLAFVFISRTGGTHEAGAPMGVAQSAPAPAAIPAEPAPATPLLLASEASSAEADARFAWMNQVQLTPIDTQALATDLRSFSVKEQNPQPGTLASPQSPQEDAAHQAAFRFQR